MSGSLLGETEQLRGEVVGVHYADRDRGFGVVELDPLGSAEGARCVGPLAAVVEGQTVELVGRWIDDPRYGRTFEAVYYEQVTPSSREGLQAFLASERFEGVGQAAIERVLSTFGTGSGRVVEREPERLVSEARLDPPVAQLLHTRWMEGRALADLVRLVEPAGWPFDAIRAAHARFGSEVVGIAREDPYALIVADRVRFAHVDRLGGVLGIDPTDPRRLAAGAVAAVVGARREGHEHLPRPRCVDAAGQLLGVDAVLAAEGVEHAAEVGLLVVGSLPGNGHAEGGGGDRVTIVSTPGAAATEQQLADELLRVARAQTRLAAIVDRRALAEELTSDQKDAVRAAFVASCSVLTGGPGTGKTRTVQEILRIAEDGGLNVAMCAPTGRGARRLEELTGGSASTVHRLLGAQPDPSGGFTFTYGAGQRLPHDLLIVDEVSMCDTSLACALVCAVEDGAHLVLVGDPDQLPSVGPGDVLRDVIRSGAVEVTRLEEIHRQAVDSRIVALARDVLAGDPGALPGVDGEVYVAEESDRDAIVARVVRAVAERAPQRFGVDVGDVQVLAPVYRGPVGVDALNTALKRELNPSPGGTGLAGLDPGDRVMQTRNDVELDVANGDIGRVLDVSPSRGEVRVSFPRGEVRYDRRRMRDLVPAWAVTVHKSQGGEWPVVVLVCDRSHAHMLWRNLLYTAVTRARDALIVVGQREVLRAGARRDQPSERWTGLDARLVSAAGGDPEAGSPSAGSLPDRTPGG